MALIDLLRLPQMDLAGHVMFSACVRFYKFASSNWSLMILSDPRPPNMRTCGGSLMVHVNHPQSSIRHPYRIFRSHCVLKQVKFIYLLGEDFYQCWIKLNINLPINRIPYPYYVNTNRSVSRIFTILPIVEYFQSLIVFNLFIVNVGKFSGTSQLTHIQNVC